jgi:hypothetical protein
MRFLKLSAVLCLALVAANAPAQINIPELYVLATTPMIAGGSPEIRVSYDGRLWSGPSFPKDSAGRPIAAAFGVPPGIGTNYQKYLLAFFDTSGTLNTMESVDGLTWTNRIRHGSFSVTQHSRPSVAYDTKTSRWYVAFRRADDTVFVRGFSAIDGSGTTATIVPDVRTTQAIGFAITTDGVPSSATHSRQLLAWRSGGIFMKQTLDPNNWPAGGGIDTGLGSESGPFLSTSFGMTRIALASFARPAPGDDTDRVHHGTLSVLEATSESLASWQRLFFVDGGTGAATVSAAFAGPFSATVAAKGNGGVPTTSTWFSSGASTVVLGGTERELHTATGLDASMAFGNDDGTSLRKVKLIFFRFQRGFLKPRATEDVVLNVEHQGGQRIPGLDSSRPVVATMTPWQVTNAAMDATVSWGSGHGGVLPKFGLMMQEGDRIVVQVTGDDGTVSQTLTFKDVVDALHSGVERELTVDIPSTTNPYRVFFIAETP